MTKSDRVRLLLRQGGRTDAEIAHIVGCHRAMVRKIRNDRPYVQSYYYSSRALKIISAASKRKWADYREAAK